MPVSVDAEAKEIQQRKELADLQEVHELIQGLALAERVASAEKVGSLQEQIFVDLVAAALAPVVSAEVVSVKVVSAVVNMAVASAEPLQMVVMVGPVHLRGHPHRQGYQDHHQEESAAEKVRKRKAKAEQAEEAEEAPCLQGRGRLRACSTLVP